LEDWKSSHELDVETAKQEIKKLNETIQQETEIHDKLKVELEEFKQKLVNTTMEYMQLKETKEHEAIRTSSSSPSVHEKSDSHHDKKSDSHHHDKKSDSLNDKKSPPEPQSRSWNKKVIYEMQYINRQLNNEKKARKELEQYKAEQETKADDMKKRLKLESEARIKLEENYKKLEKDLNELKARTKT